MNTADFEKLVEQCLKEIPKKFRDLLENITIEVEPNQISVDKDRRLILGLYNGVPLPYRGPAYQGVMPDIVHHRGGWECGNEGEEQIRTSEDQ